MRGASAIDLRRAAVSFDEPTAEPLGGKCVSPSSRRCASDMRAIWQSGVFAGDLVAIAGGGVAASWICNGALSLRLQDCAQIVMCCLIFASIMQIAGMCRFVGPDRRQSGLSRLSRCWTGAVVLVVAIACLDRRLDGAWMLLWALIGWLGLIGTRSFAAWMVRHFRADFVRRIAVVGDPIAARHCARRLERDGADEIEVVGVFALPDRSAAVGAKRGYASAAFACLQAIDARIDTIVLAMPCSELPDLEAVFAALGPRAADIDIGLTVPGGDAGGALVLLPLWRRPLAGGSAVLKRAIDVAASAVLLIGLLPLMAVIATLVKLDSPGPALFRQRRFGFGKEPFELYKFRSMRCEAGGDPAAPQARRRDPRVTRVGGFLRRTSLDELPQLLNVLKGDMSLVGPRPHAMPHDEKFAALIEGYMRRHHVKPGITGWAQVHGWRGETDTLEKMERRVEYDVYYVRHWSLLLDLQILCRTLGAVFGQRNAY